MFFGFAAGYESLVGLQTDGQEWPINGHSAASEGQNSDGRSKQSGNHKECWTYQNGMNYKLNLNIYNEYSKDCT